MSLADYARALTRRWRIVLIAVLLGGLLGVAYVAAVPVRYEARAQVFVTTAGDDDVGTAYAGLLFLQQRVKSYAGAVTSPVLLNAVIEELDLGMSAADLADAVEVDVPLDTAILTIRVTDEDPERAAAVADALGEQFIEALPELENISADIIPVTAGMLGTAVVPQDPVRPRPIRDIGVSLALGLLIGAAWAIARDFTDTVVKDETSVRAITDTTVLGSLPSVRSRGETGIVVQRGDTQPRAQGYRALRASLAMVNDAHPRSLVLTSAVVGEGKNALAANLALATAETGARVCLVEADLRDQGLPLAFGLRPDVGLTDVLTGRAALDDALTQYDDQGLTVIGAGAPPRNPTQLLGSPRMASLIRELEGRYDLVVLNSPPVLGVADALELSRVADEVVLVVGLGHCRTDQLAEALAALDRVGATVRGIVLDEGASGDKGKARGAAARHGKNRSGARAGLQGARR